MLPRELLDFRAIGMAILARPFAPIFPELLGQRQ